MKKVKCSGHGFTSFDNYRLSVLLHTRRCHLADPFNATEDPYAVSPLKRVKPDL